MKHYIYIFQIQILILFFLPQLQAQQKDTVAVSTENATGDKMVEVAYGKQTAKSVTGSIRNNIF